MIELTRKAHFTHTLYVLVGKSFSLGVHNYNSVLSADMIHQNCLRKN